jgi:hypothetical protein
MEEEEDPLILKRAIQLLKKLTPTHPIEIQALAIARKHFKNTNSSLRLNVMYLLNALSAQGTPFEEFSMIVEELVYDDYFGIREEIGLILERAIALNQINEKKISMIITLLRTSDQPYKMKLIDLLIEHVESKYNFDAAIEIVQNLLLEEDLMIKMRIIELMRALLKQEQKSKKLFLIIEQLARDPNSFIASMVFDIFGEIINSGHRTEELVQFLNTMMNDTNQPNKDKVLFNFDLLIRKGSAVKEAVTFAEQYANDSDVSIRLLAISILEQFAIQDTSGEESMAIFTRILHSKHLHVFTPGNIARLIDKFIEKGKQIESIIKLSEQWINIPGDFSFMYGSGRLELLAKKGFMREQILALAESYEKYPSLDEHHSLAKTLVKLLNNPEKEASEDSDSLWDW